MSLRCLSEGVRQIQRSSSQQRSNRGSSIHGIERRPSCLEMGQGPWYYKVQIPPPRNFPVIPAKAGIQTIVTHWIPTFVGMTEGNSVTSYMGPRKNLQTGIS